MKISHFFYLDKEEKNVCPDAISLSYERDWSILHASLQSVGMICPISVRKKEGGWDIVSGKGRWLCFKGPKVPAIEVICSEREALDLNLHENIHRGFNPVECARIIRRLAEDFSLPLRQIGETYAPLLGIGSGTKIVEDHLSLLKLPPSLLPLIARGSLDWRTSLVFLDFLPEEASFLAELSLKMRWNSNKQREALTLIWEISRKRKVSAIELFQSPEILDLWDVEKAFLNEDELRRRLKAIKCPESTSHEKSFADILGQYLTDGRLQIKPFPSFEKEGITVQFYSQNIGIYGKMVDLLLYLKEKGAVEKLLALTRLE